MKLLREPLLHFLILGGLLFGAYAWLNRDAPATTVGGVRTVHITDGEVAWLRTAWERQWRRAPDDRELQGLVADYLREELLAREARELGLDEGDTIVRRRLAQKMTFLLEDTAQAAEPTEEELRRLYEANRERFRTAARVSFTQVYFNRDRRGDRSDADAGQALVALSRGTASAAAAGIGDPSLLQRDFADLDEEAVASRFGAAFARTVGALEPGRWHGPIESGYGLHLVRVAASRPPQQRSFTEVRAQLQAEWRRERQKSADEQYFAGLLEKYNVVVDESLKPLLGRLPAAKGG
jgi:hypothetical protein